MTRLLRSSIALLATLVLFAACDEDGSIPSDIQKMFGIVQGTVIVEGEPQAGLTVQINTSPAQTTTTDANGAFTFSTVQEGSYVVSVAGQNVEIQFASASISVTVVGEQTSTVSFTGTIIRNSTISGTVRLDGAGESGRTVNLSGPEGTQATTTSALGAYEFEELRQGTYTVSLGGIDENVRFENTEETVELSIGQQRVVDFSGIREIFASGFIRFIEDANSGARLAFSNVKGNVEVEVRVEGGTRELEFIRLYLGEDLAGEIDVTSGAGAFAPEDFRIAVATAPFDPDTGAPLIPNGDTSLRLELETALDGLLTVDEEDITLNNGNQIGAILFETDPATGMLGEGNRTWFGGQDLEFRVIPVIYDPDVEVGFIEVDAFSDASANGGPGLDFGSGPGEAHMVAGPDFTFTAPAALNDGFVEDEPNGDGHTILVRRVFDPDMNAITNQFERSETLEDFWVDFVGPRLGLNPGILLDEAQVPSNSWLGVGDISIRNVSETGSGGLDFRVDVLEGVTVVQADVTSIAGLPEGDIAFIMRLTSLTDLLGNSTDVSGVPDTNAFGIDRTPIEFSNFKPALPGEDGDPRILNPSDDGGDGEEDNWITVTIQDPQLADGSPGSGYGEVTFTGVEEGGQFVDRTTLLTPKTQGVNTIDIESTVADGTYTFTYTASDNATPANMSEQTFTLIIDDTEPEATFTDAPNPEINTSSGAIGFTVAGSVTDPNGLRDVTIRAQDATSTGTVDCESTDTDWPAGSDPGDINRGPTNVTSTADDWELVYTVQRPTGGGSSLICIGIFATDRAEDINGNAEGNFLYAAVRTIINWI